MPRKNISPAIKILVRNNQRRSRARRKELVDDLQRRLQEYEQRGVQASIHMQIAARAVKAENQHLRDLLARHGVSADEVERYLRCQGVEGDGQNDEDNDGGPRFVSLHSTGCTSPASRDLQHQSQPAETQNFPELALPPPQADIKSSTTSTISVSANISYDHSENILVGQDEYATHDRGEQVPFHHEINGAIAASDGEPMLPPQTGVSRTSASNLEMPCEAAASIVADVQGHGDHTLVYAALGCSTEGTCLVKNITILDLIDKNI